MGFTLDKVVPWGRSYAEYVQMFDLSESDLKKCILGCGDGPASFNAELNALAGNIISVDPIYLFSTEQIKQRIDEVYPVIMDQLENNKKDYIWHTISSVSELGHIRLSAMEKFLSDYDEGKLNGRYIEGELPSLPFKDKQFELVLSSHFLFLYGQHLSLEFHIQALKEMLRVGNEMRVFPLLSLDGKPSPYLSAVIQEFKQQGFQVEIKTVKYEFQKGGNQLLVIY